MLIEFAFDLELIELPRPQTFDCGVEWDVLKSLTAASHGMFWISILDHGVAMEPSGPQILDHGVAMERSGLRILTAVLRWNALDFESLIAVLRWNVLDFES